MTTSHLPVHRLHDYLDNLLCREERAEVERHLAVCAPCRDEVARLRDLLAELAVLPPAERPERDLLPGIHAAIDAEASRRAGTRRLAAAAAIVVLVGAAAGVRLSERSPAPASGAAAARPDAIDAAWQQQAAEMERLLAHNRQNLHPRTVRVLEDNLLVIDRALAEARAALRSDPGNPVLEELLLATHRKKLDLLRGAARGGT